MILFSADITSNLQKQLMEANPDQEFIFYKNMEAARTKLPEAEVLVTYGEDLTDELIKEAVSLKWIMVISAGLEKMPLQAIRERGILVTNARGIHSIPMAEYAISMILQVYRKNRQLVEYEKANEWAHHLSMDELHGKTMVILGAGAIGQEVARLAKAFHVKTIGVSRSGTPVASFDEVYSINALNSLLPQADIFISILPSTDKTRGMLRYDNLAALPEHAIFMNLGRGDVIATNDILRAVNEEQIAHAVLDVFEEEPLPAGHSLWDHEFITVTPHISSRSKHYEARALEIFQKNLMIYGKEKQDYVNKIDLTRGY
ncbi:D-2-hydroxyacid dehydrogenase [Oceanobacillus kapialis]|uniref:D-2-hydroxyacid dehydrogenase n=1 Tax=Oceanobacillus kapialis TaxID=481353 RepID=A0ABW5PZP4_9BACI